jgi:uncharacterized protein VirK/YbjX
MINFKSLQSSEPYTMHQIVMHGLWLAVLLSLLTGFTADCRRTSAQVAVKRVMRASRIFVIPDGSKRLFQNAAYKSHVKRVTSDDTFFFLSHRHYLANGFTAVQRAQAALYHYEHEVSAFSPLYFERVYDGDGLVLWHADIDQNVFDIRLMPGNDVLYEGGMSVVFYQNNERICVVSYSSLPTDIFSADMSLAKQSEHAISPLQKTIIYITRKQTTANYSYQKVFNKAFDRTTPAHMCIGALAGLAAAQGQSQMIGIATAVHPSLKAERQQQFEQAYDQFWLSLGAKQLSNYGYLIDTTLSMTSLESLDAKARKRAILRRQHIQQAYVDSLQQIRAHLNNKG